MTTPRPSILLMADHFLPGYKAGGPIRSVLNLVAALRDDFRFSILTRDRDLGVATPYPDLATGVWHPRDGYDVQYLTPRATLPPGVWRAVRGRPHDLVYLNSFFSNFTISALLLRRLGLLPRRPVVLAPRGELATNAMRLKSGKKSAYKALARAFGLYRPVVWHASSEREAEEIRRFSAGPIVVAPNLPTPVDRGHDWSAVRPPKRAGAARFVFLGRVARMKNLAYALRAIRQVDGEVVFDVFGTEEDRAYLAECRALIDAMPPHVRCRFHGPVPPDRVRETLERYHFFLLPTLRENFGHGILEALVSGLPVVISDETIWRDLEREGAGFDLPLADEARFVAALRRCVALDGEEYARLSRGAHAFGRRYLDDPSRAARVRELFLGALGGVSR